MKDHIETIEMDYDPQIVCYENLLEIFWKSGCHNRVPYSRQYKSAIFVHNNEQLRLVRASEEKYKDKHGISYVEVIDNFSFFIAEDYHQKYWLQHTPFLLKTFFEVYDTMTAFIHATATARINGYIRGYGNHKELELEFPKFTWPQKQQQEILAFLHKRDL